MADGTVVTLGPSGQGYDYTDIATANAEIPADITGTAGDYVFEIYSGATLNGFTKPNVTTDASHRIVYRAAPGHEVNGAGVGAGFISATGAHSEYFIGTPVSVTYDSHVDFINLAIIHKSGSSVVPALRFDDSLNNRFYNCFIKSETSGGLEFANGGAAGVHMENCIIADCAGENTYYNNISGAASVELVNCTSVNSGGGIGFYDRNFGNASSIRMRNCLAYGNATRDYRGKLDQSDVDFIASEDSSASAESATTGFDNRTAADFVDYAGGNYNTAESSSLFTAGEGGEPIGAVLGGAPAPSQNVDLDGDVTLPAMTSTGSANATLPQPSITGSSQLAAITSTGQASVTLPQPSISASVSFSPVEAVGAASATLPQPTITGAISITAASANGSALATLPDPSLSGSVTFSGVTASGGATATLPGFNASGAITLPSMLATGQAEATLPQAPFGAAVTLRGLQASGVATATEPGFNVSGNALLPALSAAVSASATLPQGSFSGNITLPSIQASGYIVGGQVIIQIEPDANIQAPSMSSSITAPRLSTNVTR